MYKAMFLQSCFSYYLELEIFSPWFFFQQRKEFISQLKCFSVMEPFSLSTMIFPETGMDADVEMKDSAIIYKLIASICDVLHSVEENFIFPIPNYKLA